MNNSLREPIEYLHIILQYCIFLNGRTIATSRGEARPHLILRSLCLSQSTSQTASRSVQPFLQGSVVTDRQTDRHTSPSVATAASGYCCDAAKKDESHSVESWDHCLWYSHTQMAPVTCTFSDRINPHCGISTQTSSTCRNSSGIPVFSFLHDTRTHVRAVKFHAEQQLE